MAERRCVDFSGTPEFLREKEELMRCGTRTYFGERVDCRGTNFRRDELDVIKRG